MKDVRIILNDDLDYETICKLLSNIDNESKITLILSKLKLGEVLKEYRNEIIDEIISKICDKT